MSEPRVKVIRCRDCDREQAIVDDPDAPGGVTEGEAMTIWQPIVGALGPAWLCPFCCETKP